MTLLNLYQDALRQLAQSDALTSGDWPLACRAVTESCGTLLNVERTSIWLFDKDRQAISLVDLYEAGSRSHRSNMVLKAIDYPAYFQALRVINMSLAAKGDFAPQLHPLCEAAYRKGLVIVAQIRAHRIGFLVDAAIFGFAVGTGFAVVENLYFLYLLPQANMTTWMVRGLGTAIMHGGVASMFAIMAQTLTERQMRINPLYYLPGLAVAVFLHSVFNHFRVAPVLQAVGTLLLLPPLLQLMFHRSARRLHQWMEVDFDQ